MNLYTSKPPHIAIIGAGYSGLSCAFRVAQKLHSSRGPKALITLVNKDTKQELSTELYRTLRTGRGQYFKFLDSLRRLDVRFIEGHVSDIRPNDKTFHVRGETHQEIKYDQLVIASGFKPQVPPLEGLEAFLDAKDTLDKRVFPFRNNIQVQQLRLALKRLGWSADTRFTKDVFVVVLGAGSTGLEVAGELAHLRGNNSRARVIVVDEKKGLLNSFSPIAKKMLKTELSRLRIETVLGSPAKSLNDRELNIMNGQVIPWDLLVLCTGGRPSQKLLEAFGDVLTPEGLKVKRNLQIEGFPDHYAIGDIAHIKKPSNHQGIQSYLAKTAQFAVQEGEFVGEILADKVLEGTPLGTKRFSSNDLGYMVSLGPYSGFGRVGPEIDNVLGKFFSPFIVGPPVDQFKRAAKARYVSGLRWTSWKAKLNPFT